MRTLDILVLSWRQLKERKLRSILTVLAIAVGVTTIIALSAQVEGVKAGIVQSLGKLGPDTIIISSQGRASFTDADVERLRDLEEVSSVTPLLMMNVKVTELDSSTTLIGLPASSLTNYLGEVRLLEGEIYQDAPSPQALIGSKIAVDDAGQTKFRTGQPILVQVGKRLTPMTVVGVLDKYGSSMMIQADSSIFLPLEYVKTLTRSGGYTLILVKASNPEAVDQLQEFLGYIFGGRATILTVKQITNIVSQITSMINILLLGIAGTSFIAAGLGTFNIMMISVLERVREIGVFKALGFRDRGVLLLYMTQGMLLGLFGSIVGIGFGTAVSYALPAAAGNLSFGQGMPTQQTSFGGGAGMNFMSSYTPVIAPLYLVVATALSIAITLLSTAYPAWRASRLSPVEALRYE